MKKKINSRQKGARGEREFAEVLSLAGFPARRGQQFSGGKDSPDVVCDTLGYLHFEVKRTQSGNPYKWMEQASRDAGEVKIPVVAHRRDGQEWLAILTFRDFLRLIKDAKKDVDLVSGGSGI